MLTLLLTLAFLLCKSEIALCMSSSITKPNTSIVSPRFEPQATVSHIPWWLGGALWYQAYEKTKSYLGMNRPLAADLPQNYSINLMWINRQPQVNQPYIYPATSQDNYGKKFLDVIIAWAKKNPEGVVHLWFDSYMTSQIAVENTKKALAQESSQHTNIAKIELHDIRDLVTVKENATIFSPDIPVYFRADLLRPILAKEALLKNKDSSFVYTDFDVKPLSKSELFDKKTLANLKKHHFVMAHENNILGFENSFQMFTYDENLVKAMDTMLIKANILRVQELESVGKKRECSEDIFASPFLWKVHKGGFQENIFYSYPLMYAYLAQLQNKEPLVLPGSDTAFDEKRDFKKLDELAKVIMARSSAREYVSRVPMPTKYVFIPPTLSLQAEIK